MELRLKNKTALVTGASMGIGRAIAQGLAEEGVRICITARREQLLRELAGEIVALGGPAPHVVVADIMDSDAPQRVAKEALAGLGHVDILINCAGGSRPLPINAPEETWDEAMTLNFTRVRQVTHALLPQMIERGWGRIINITGKQEQVRLNAAYSAKAGVHAWAKGLSKELGRYGITVNSIPPGRIISEQILRNNPEPVRREFAAQHIPVGRFGEPEELACLAVFLASPLAGYISGTVIPVDGGLRRYTF
ncbi:MAG: SDR family oxidoreductase [Betaproteobacteria bacterium]|nr:SDR family oxidoreductase [Betaproteobacteria bacterium]